MILDLQLLLNSDLQAMAVKNWSAARQFLLKSDLWPGSVTRQFLLKNDLRLSMAVKYWYMYTLQIKVLNNDLRFVIFC